MKFNRMTKRTLPYYLFTLSVFLICAFAGAGVASSRDPSAVDMDEQVKQWAGSCNREIVSLFESYIDSGSLTLRQLFDTFYIPIPHTNPPKYRTQYDRIVEKPLQKILDRYRARHKNLIYVMAVDAYGYLPAYHSEFSGSFTSNQLEDYKNNKKKRILNDRIGRAAAGNKKTVLIQQIPPVNGEAVFDLSTPIFINHRHWGAVRFGYHKGKNE